MLLARGRDYADVRPLSGVYSGQKAELFGVTVEITQLGRPVGRGGGSIVVVALPTDTDPRPAPPTRIATPSTGCRPTTSPSRG